MLFRENSTYRGYSYFSIIASYLIVGSGQLWLWDKFFHLFWHGHKLRKLFAFLEIGKISKLYFLTCKNYRKYKLQYG